MACTSSNLYQVDYCLATENANLASPNVIKVALPSKLISDGRHEQKKQLAVLPYFC